MHSEEIKVYCCDYCGYVGRNPGGTARHEWFCKKNPKNKAMCYSCKHYEEHLDTVEVMGMEFDGGYTRPEKRKFNPNRCTLHDEKLFNASRMWDGTRAMLEAEYWKPMPTEAKPCLDYVKDDFWESIPLLAIREGGKS
jgi:hypothetical protein